MKFLITGRKGMLERTLQNEFADCELVIADRPGRGSRADALHRTIDRILESME